MYGYYGYYGYGYYPYGFGWGRGWGRGRRGGWGRGWGRGFGYGATLGYCPWTELPRGWRWMYPYGYGTYGVYGTYPPVQTPYYRPAGTYAPYPQAPGTVDEKSLLESEARSLEERLKEIERRISELKGE